MTIQQGRENSPPHVGSVSPILLCCGLRTGHERLRGVVLLTTAPFLQLRETKASFPHGILGPMAKVMWLLSGRLEIELEVVDPGKSEKNTSAG